MRILILCLLLVAGIRTDNRLDLVVKQAVLVAHQTGPGKAGRVFGTDLGITWDGEDGKVYQAFGDTYRGPRGAGWIPNWIATSQDHDPTDGISFEPINLGEDGFPKPFLKVPFGANTIIPTSGVADGGNQYVHHMNVVTFYDDEGDRYNWALSGSGLAVSHDHGLSWQETQTKWRGDSRFAMVAFVKSEGYIYVFGNGPGRLFPARLARVPSGKLTDKASYRYWNNGAWSEKEDEASDLTPDAVGELSIRYLSAHKRWIMMSWSQDKNTISVRYSTSLTGPWGSPQTVVRGAPFGYAPQIHPWFLDGDSFYMNLSNWAGYNVDLYRVDLVKR